MPLTVPSIEHLTSLLYGSDWDILWLGHCGAHSPSPSPSHPNRVTIPDDITVPEPQHLKPHSLSAIDGLATFILCTRESCIARIARPAAWHTHSQRVQGNCCTNSGSELFRGYDFMLSDWCDGLMFGFRDLQDPESPADSEDLGATVRVLQAAQMTGNRPDCLTIP